MVHVFHATINKADHQLNRGLKLTAPLVAFWLRYGIKPEQQTQHHREEHGVNIDCPEGGWGFVDPPARMYAGPAEGYSGGVLCNPAASYFLKP